MDFASPAGKRQYRRGLLHREETAATGVAPVGGPGSHLLASMAQANCLIITDEETTTVARGSAVTVIPLLLAGRDGRWTADVTRVARDPAHAKGGVATAAGA